ncbi:MAG: ThuA domain-containing protein, partial [Cyclobacteriaceae bacterium]|nr:ThuA domain-containing protein [Cyclobacteriaceae bacterium]
MSLFKLLFQSVCLLFITVISLEAQVQQKWKVLLIDGQNNHDNWPKTSKLMIGYLEETGLFEVERATTPAKGELMDSFHPDFSKYDLVLSNYNGDPWPLTTRDSFEAWLKKGGAFVVVHAADNAFPEWEEYNKMIGLGG